MTHYRFKSCRHPFELFPNAEEGDENVLTGGRGALSTNAKEKIRKFDPRWEPFFTILKHPLKLDTKVCDKIHNRQNQLSPKYGEIVSLLQ